MQQLTDQHNNYVKVAYQLVHDYRQTIEFGNISEKLAKEHLVETPEWHPATLSSSGTHESPEVIAAEEVYSSSYITKLPPSSYLASSGASTSFPARSGDESAGANSPVLAGGQQGIAASNPTAGGGLQTKAKKHKKKSKWHFGIRSRGSPKKIMMELYKAMKNIDLEWKPITIFHVRCRFQENGKILASSIETY